ncbi:DUF523 domain-containing protein [Peptostreptococcus equinus]|uniref:DUF523 domain-containing protein n=1 Tax=Peptostreptococcus equinus TaxID=3003601 RepID=A0ABY7JSC0_9FIRM|nr:DUF523 domain-containing protein [Peptostreptococcus sp. CBA3647]WAW15391.1 DUF523 domain-containing protein [Peptostreptococcus sp. CBA3647]
MKILVSSCLLGQDCKYNGKNNYSKNVMDYIKGHEIISVCPEVMGGLPIPRVPAEIVNDIVIDKNGKNVNDQFVLGTERAYKLAEENSIDLAILKAKSPSCGYKEIYDGTFSGKLIEGNGLFAKKLIENGYKVMNENDL